MRKMLEMLIQKQTYEPHFGSAMDRFVEACRNIAQNPQCGLLSKLIKTLFTDAKLDALLHPSIIAKEIVSIAPVDSLKS
jgi:hypothetical protein